MSKKNHFRPGLIETCDECENVSAVLWQDKYRHLWCPDCWPYWGKSYMDTEKLRKLLEGLDDEELKTLRAMINGRLSKRKITPEQQAKMQAARKKKHS